MSQKQIYMTGAVIGSFVGSVIPLLWGDNFLSFSSIILTALGGFFGIYLAYKMNQY